MRVEHQLFGLTPPHLSACPKPKPDFPTLHGVIFFMFSDLRLEVIVCFGDIGGIVDHHCLNLFFMVTQT